MAIRITEFKVGLTVLFAVAALGWGIVWVKGYRYGQEVSRYQVYFPNVGALSAGDPVAVNGVTKGKILGLELENGQVLVRFELDKTVRLNSDATYTLKNLGLMGERFIEIYPGVSGQTADPEQPVQGQFDTGIPEVMGMMGHMITEVRELVRVLSTTVGGAPDAFRRADSTVVDLREAARILSALLSENQGNIQAAITDFQASASSLRQTVESKSSRVDSTIDRMSMASERILKAAATFDTLSTVLHQLAADVQSGQGTLGALMKDPSLYDDIKRAASDLDALVADIRANPGKYVKVDFSIF